MSKKEKADGIVYGAITSAAGGAVIPVPVADTVIISGVQIAMVVAISQVYDRTISKETAKGLIFVFAGAKFGEWLASLVKLIPGVGSVLGGAAQLTIAGSVTAAIGFGFRNLCEKGLEFTKENLKREANNERDAVKNVAKDIESKEKLSRELKKSVGFRVKQTGSKNNFQFIFNLQDVTQGSVRIVNDSSEIVFAESVKHPISNLDWDSGLLPLGKYTAFLDIEGLIPYAIALTVS